MGGMIRVQQGAATPLTPIRPVVIWSGQSAQTQPRVEHYLSATNRDAFVRESTEVVNSFSDDPVAMLAENALLLMHMSVETGLPYMTPSLASIGTLAKQFGGAAKPSGAGGGDCAIALFPDPDAEAAFVAELDRRGRTHIPILVAGPAGLVNLPDMV